MVRTHADADTVVLVAVRQPVPGAERADSQRVALRAELVVGVNSALSTLPSSDSRP